MLRAALSAAPRDRALHRALGLTLVRLIRRVETLEELREAAGLAPEQPRFAYIYAVRHSAGRLGEAMTLLKGHAQGPSHDGDILQALVAFSRDAGEFAAALGYAERLARNALGDPDLAKLIQDLRRHAIKAQDH